MTQDTLTKLVLGGLASVLIFIGIYFNGCQPEPQTQIVNSSVEKAKLPKVSITIDEKPESSYKGSALDMKSSTYHSSLGNLWTTDPGETVSRVEGQEYAGAGAPGVNIDDSGVSTTATEGGAYVASSGDWGIFDTIWDNIKKFLWLGSLGVGALILLYFLVPAAQPIIGGIFRAIASVFPFIGSMVERITAGFKWEKPLKETVIGGQKFKQLVRESNEFTSQQKEAIRNIFNEAMQSKQDVKSQKTIRNIKAEKEA